MAKIWLYNISDGPEVVHKFVGVVKAEVEVQLLPECTIKRPVLKMSAENVDLTTCNYFFLDKFNRYYYIDSSSGIDHNNMIRLIGDVDPLKSFENGIDGLTCVVTRNEFEFNGDIVDEEIIPRVKKQLTKKIIRKTHNFRPRHKEWHK
mgnify:CR=1 FL=1